MDLALVVFQASDLQKNSDARISIVGY